MVSQLSILPVSDPEVSTLSQSADLNLLHAGEKFDPSSMEALYQAPVPGKEPGSVLECSKIGYKIKNRVLRAAQVGVVQDS
jgi:molecular chaperone GrpE (heat shock protein)